jgi:hypothetical protein
VASSSVKGYVDEILSCERMVSLSPSLSRVIDSDLTVIVANRRQADIG